MKKLLISILILDLIIFNITLSQVAGNGKEFPSLPMGSKIEPSENQLSAWNSFKATHGQNWQVRWSDKTGTPASILGLPIEVSGSNAKEKARTFLIQNNALFGIDKQLSDLKVKEIEERLRATHVIYEQFYQEIRVEGGVYGLHFTKDNKIYLVNGEYHKNVFVPTVTPTLTLSQAIDISQQDFGDNLDLRNNKPSGELVILPYGDEFLLSWKVTVYASEPFGDWVYFISASNGSILIGYNTADFTSAQGSVYDHHPEAGSVVTRTVTNLSGNGYYLNGIYVKSLNEDTDEAYEPDLAYIYDPSNTHFDEVMVYYHANIFQDEYLDNLGYPYLNYPNSIVKVEATVHVGTNYNNAYASYPKTLGFGDGDGISYYDFAKEDNVICHEYQHLVTEYTTYDGLDGGFEEEAMDEAFSDYFACSFAGSHLVGEYVKVGAGSLRNLDNNFTMSDFSSLGNYHNVGQIFSGALWDMRQQLGQAIADILAFEGLDNLDQATPAFIDGYEAIVAADYALYSGSHISTIENIFIGREIIWKGTISQNKTWSGGTYKKIYVVGNVAVTNGATLTINSGRTIYFDGYYGLTIHSGSKIIAEGTQNQPILFTSATGSQPNSWYCIVLYGGNNVFKHCEFKYGNCPLYLYYCTASEGSRNLIENCTIHHSYYYGIDVYRSLANIKGCNIYNNNYHGICCRTSSDVKLTGNVIYNNTQNGILSYTNNFLEFYGNVIEQNGQYGIYTNGADHIHLGEPYNQYFYGYNTIRNNGNTEVYAYSSNPHVEAQYSSIHEENPSAPGYEIYNYPGNQNIFTQNCFWGDNCTPKYNSDGNFTFQNPQCTPIWDGDPFMDGPLGKMNLTRQDEFVSGSNNDFIIDMSLSDEEKIKSCKEIIANQPNSKDACDALILLYSILRADYLENTLGERNDFYSYLNNLYSKHANKGIGKTALRYMIYWKMLENDDEAVIKLSNKALEFFTGEEHNDILANLAITHAHRAELKEAKSILNELKAKCSAEDELVQLVSENIADVEWQIAEGIWEQDKTGKPLPPPEDQPVTALSDEFTLTTNYPNPFNAITTITFSLPEASQVKTEVYDLTGRCVAVLCDRRYPAGTYSVQFDGTALASGIYILRSQMTSTENPGQSQVFSRKMMLMK